MSKKDFSSKRPGARRGGLASYKQQGGIICDPVVRKQRWCEWWEREGRFKAPTTFKTLPFHEPIQSIALAEFVGIMMGDGGMTHRQLCITLHHIDDLEYSRFVIALIKKLFEVRPGAYHEPHHSVNRIVISRSGIIEYLHKMGLPIGNKVKQRFDVPPWIKDNREYMIACIRGLVDTDGSVFSHRYRVGGKLYSYKKICFSSSSPPLIQTVHDFLTEEGFYARISRSGKHIRIESVSDVKRHMDMIGPHNAKHLKRYPT